MRSFEEISRDIGGELKLSAESLYRNGMKIQMGIFCLAVISAIIAGISAEEFPVFLVITGSALVEYMIAAAAIYFAAVRRYAEGEKVHLLEQIAKNGQPSGDKGEVEKKPAAVTESTPSPAKVPMAVTKSAPSLQASIAQTNARNDAQKRVPPSDRWECACGKMNPPYIFTCSCGRNKRDQVK